MLADFAGILVPIGNVFLSNQLTFQPQFQSKRQRTHCFGRPVLYDQANCFLRDLLVSEFRRIHKTKSVLTKFLRWTTEYQGHVAIRNVNRFDQTNLVVQKYRTPH